MRGVYVTYVANADKGQSHVVTLIWSLKIVVTFQLEDKRSLDAM